MTVTFDGAVLVNAGKRKFTYPTLTSEKILLSGKRSVQSSPEFGFNATYGGLCSQAEFLAVLAKVGVKGTLITEDGQTITNCYITGDIQYSESDNPLYVNYSFNFVKDTTQ